MYVITSGEIKREYDTSEPHIALQKFFNETDSDLDSTTIRSYGGATYPARVLWPRKRVKDRSSRGFSD